MSYKKLKGYVLKRLVQISTDGQAVGTSLVEVKTIVNQSRTGFGVRNSGKLQEVWKYPRKLQKRNSCVPIP
jgi:hypothetical protein